jgi:mono/diheme cytochrome c family protein
MRCFYKILVFLAALMAGGAAWAQAPNYKNVGRAPTPDEIRAWDTAVGPAGKGLPPGSGTAKEGAGIFAEKCVVCHSLAGGGVADGSATGWWQGHTHDSATRTHGRKLLGLRNDDL